MSVQIDSIHPSEFNADVEKGEIYLITAVETT